MTAALLVINLGISLYLAWRLHAVAQLADITETVLVKFVAKIAKEKIEAGEWSEDETI